MIKTVSLRAYLLISLVLLVGLFCSTTFANPSNFDGYSFLVYDCNDMHEIIHALPRLGIDNFDVRDLNNPVTGADLASHDVLIVGWNEGGNTSGLDPNLLLDGITGNTFLTGHDFDFHVCADPDTSRLALMQAIEFALKRGGCGLVGLADRHTGFGWLPSEWEISANTLETAAGDTISGYTADGIASGIYNDLTPSVLSGWDKSYHCYFTGWGSDFESFELGGSMSGSTISIGKTISPKIEITLKDNLENNPNATVLPDDDLVYTIEYKNVSGQTLSNITIKNYLPDGVTFNLLTSQTGSYDSSDRSCTWNIGDLAPNNPNDPCDFESVSVSVIVNGDTEPGMPLLNRVRIFSGTDPLASATKKTKVNCFGSDIVYVDESADGCKTGTSWANAYTDLRDALYRIRSGGCGTQIWIAKGEYSPGIYYRSSFIIPDNISIYGGFGGYETSINQRNISQNETILTGVNLVGEKSVAHVITAGNGSLIDGVTIKQASTCGIYGANVTFTVSNCVIEDNDSHGIQLESANLTIANSTIGNNAKNGIYSKKYDDSSSGIFNCVVSNCILENNQKYAIYLTNANLTITNSLVRSNGWHGIYCTNSSATLTMDSCKIYSNIRDGVYCYYSQPAITNSVIYDNGSGSDAYHAYYGINLYETTADSKIQNCTITKNHREGIKFYGSSMPVIENDIIWFNNESGGFVDFAGIAESDCLYCCISDPNDPNAINTTFNAHNNLRSNPGFRYQDDGSTNFHLCADSPCRDTGNPSGSFTSEDFDGEPRVNSTVDIGADEVWENIADLNQDGIVDLLDFGIEANSWQTVSGASGWNPICDLHPIANGDGDVDEDDLLVFYDNWLWQAGWRSQDYVAQSQFAQSTQPTQLAASSKNASSESTLESADKIDVLDKALNIYTSLRLLDDIWKEDPTFQGAIEPDRWFKFRDSVEDSLKAIDDQIDKEKK